MQTDTLTAPATAGDTFPINGTDYIEFWVGNAKQASLYYRAAFGFQLVGVPGPGDRGAGPGELPAAAGQDPVRADDADPAGPDEEARPSRTTSTATATACGTSRCGWTMRARPTPRPSSGARSRRRSRGCCGTTTARS